MSDLLNFTEEAQSDVINIYLYGLEHYGIRQAEKYSEKLADKLKIVAENPSFGTDYNDIRPGLHRYESVSHSIYYQPTKGGILVLRILHGKMDPARHF